MTAQTLEQLIKRAKAEFVEMPGLKLTIEQSSRLWGIEPAQCKTLLHALVRRNFLAVTDDGQYLRATDIVARTPPMRPARASLRSATSSGRFAGTPADRPAGGRSSRG